MIGTISLYIPWKSCIIAGQLTRVYTCYVAVGVQARDLPRRGSERASRRAVGALRLRPRAGKGGARVPQE
jgi:hypothetical protein